MCPVGCTKTDTSMYDIVRTREAFDLAEIADFAIAGFCDFAECYTKEIPKSQNIEIRAFNC